MNLDNRFFYRFVNVLYYCSLASACLFSLLIAIDVGFWWGILSASIFYAILNDGVLIITGSGLHNCITLIPNYEKLEIISVLRKLRYLN